MRNQESYTPNPNQQPTAHRLITTRRILAVGIPTCMLAGCMGGVAGIVNGIGVEAAADVEQAQTTSHATLLAFNTTQELHVATAYAQEQFTASHIPYRIDTKPVDLVRDFEVNKQLNGVAQEQYNLPFDALSKPKFDAATGKTTVQVDKSKVTATTSWHDMPFIQDFTYDGDKKNFGHADGFRANVFKQVANSLKIVQADTFNNTYDALDSLTNHAIAAKALESVNETCTPKLEAPLEGAIRKALKKNVATINNQDPSDLVVTFTPGAFTWKEEALPDPVLKAADRYNYDGKITINRNFHVDSMDCQVPEAVALKAAKELQR
ncbi:MAG TPA: hypothetical protein VFL85_01090 [Candidatus Saccharimonadales bacterium]|nr:hypothetical protein [Candidatus Saccharimonadales bacterium]